MTGRANLRASDADRELIAERLRQAAMEGRLLAEELDERLGNALSARTYGELDALVADLPAPRAALARPSRSGVGAGGAGHPVVAVLVAATLAVMVIGVVISALTGHDHAGHGAWDGGSLIWLVWIALGWRYFARRRRGAR